MKAEGRDQQQSGRSGDSVLAPKEPYVTEIGLANWR